MSTTTSREIIAKLRQRHVVGILVQRVHGQRSRASAACRSATTAGPLRLRWNLRVNGKPLKAGHYRVTLRALASNKGVLGLSTPTTIRVRR